MKFQADSKAFSLERHMKRPRVRTFAFGGFEFAGGGLNLAQSGDPERNSRDYL